MNENLKTLSLRAEKTLQEAVALFVEIGVRQSEQVNKDDLCTQNRSLERDLQAEKEKTAEHERKIKENLKEINNLIESSKGFEAHLNQEKEKLVQSLENKYYQIQVESAATKVMADMYLKQVAELAQVKGELTGKLESLEISLLEWKQRSETNESKYSQLLNKNQSAHVGRKYEDDIIEALTKGLGHFATVSSCASQPGQMDIEVKTRVDGIVVRIDTKDFKKALPQRDMTKFYRDVDNMPFAVKGCILFASCPLVGETNDKSGALIVTERGGKMVYQIGRGATDLLLESILEIVLKSRGLGLSHDSGLGFRSQKEKEVSEEVKLFSQGAIDLLTKQSQGLNHCWEKLQDVKGKCGILFKSVVEAGRLAHGSDPEIIDKPTLSMLEKGAPALPRGRPSGNKRKEVPEKKEVKEGKGKEEGVKKSKRARKSKEE